MKISSAEFVVSSSTYTQCPKDGLSEYAFIGRSNVGKSSLINMLVGRKGLAKTSVQPGKTRLINHFLINKCWYLVDLPGYGYARIAKTERIKWEKMMKDYFLHRENLVNVYLLIDSRIPPQQIDLDFITFFGENNVPFTLVYTKVDKEKQKVVSSNISAMKDILKQQWEELPTIILTSSATGYGREELLSHIENINNSL